MRYLGIDYGSKKVGLALSDEAGTMGFPYSVVKTEEAEKIVLDLLQKEKIDGVVVGDSTNFAGEKNPIAAAAEAFARRITETTGAPVFFEPEALTSAEARRQPDAPEEVDASAAALILTSYLSRHGHAR